MKVLITGHMGLLGRHLARQLQKDDHDVHGCDIRGGLDCRETFKINDLRYDLVFHCAGEPVPARQLGIDADFFDWVDKTNPHRVVYFSSDSVYPHNLQDEPRRLAEADAAPDSPEGWVAHAAEQLALTRGAWVFRPFQVYGEGGRGLFEQVAVMVRERRAHFAAPGCGRVHDFIEVSDAVAAVLAFLDQGDPTGPINLCTGVPTAVDELALKMFEVANWTPERFVCDLDDSMFFRCGDPKAMNQVRSATVSLADGIRRHL